MLNLVCTPSKSTGSAFNNACPFTRDISWHPMSLALYFPSSQFSAHLYFSLSHQMPFVCLSGCLCKSYDVIHAEDATVLDSEVFLVLTTLLPRLDFLLPPHLYQLENPPMYFFHQRIFDLKLLLLTFFKPLVVQEKAICLLPCFYFSFLSGQQKYCFLYLFFCSNTT